MLNLIRQFLPQKTKKEKPTLTFKTEGGPYVYSWICQKCGNDNWGAWISMYATHCRKCNIHYTDGANEIISHKVS